MTIVDEAAAFSPTTERHRSRSLPSSALLSAPLGSPLLLPKFGAAPWLFEVQASIKELGLLEDGWDGGVAAQVDLAAIDRASAFVEQVAREIPPLRAPFVAPTVNGGVNLEWDEPDVHIDFEFDAAGATHVYALDHSGIEYEGFLEEAPVNAIAVLFSFRADVVPAL